jgi:hypothetical protein
MQEAAENAAQTVANAAPAARENARGALAVDLFALLCSLFVLIFGLRTYPE